MILAVTNQGKIHYIMKHPEYDFNIVRNLMLKYARKIEQAESDETAYILTKNLLKELKQVGLYYE